MREYTNKNNVQKKSYYSDRFFVAPTLKKLDPNTDQFFNEVVEALKTSFTINWIKSSSKRFNISINENCRRQRRRIKKRIRTKRKRTKRRII